MISSSVWGLLATQNDKYLCGELLTTQNDKYLLVWGLLPPETIALYIFPSLLLVILSSFIPNP